MERNFKVTSGHRLLFFHIILFSLAIVCHADSYLRSSEDTELQDEMTIDLCENCPCEGKPRKTPLYPNPIPDVSDACQMILQNFSDSVAAFSRCLAMNARPITVCQNCFEEYQDVDNMFKNISSGSEASCDEQLLNRDHLQVVQTLANQAKWYWDAAQCKHCYSDTDGGKLCNDTLEFFQILSKVMSCINNTQSINGNDEIKNASQVCAECRSEYIELNEYYESLNTKYSNRLCMDVMDAMNITRHLWSSTYKCTTLQVEMLPVLLSSIGFLCLPITYYCGNRFVASARDTKLVRPNRMSFVQTSYSSTSIQR